MVERTLDELVDRGAPTDLVGGYTLPLPLAVMSRLLGLEDLRSDRLRHRTEHAFADTTRDADEVAAGRLTARLMHLIPLGDTDEHTGLLRRAAEDVELSGRPIRAGAVVAANDAANRDPAVLSNDPFNDLFSPLESPTLAFGAGQHYCLGTWLAHTEVRLVLHRLAARLPDLRLTVALTAVEWRLGTITRSPLCLPVTW